MASDIDTQNYLPILKALKDHAEPAHKEHEFLKWALQVAKTLLPDCTLMFIKFEQFSPVYRPADSRQDKWTEELIAAVKLQVKRSGHRSFDGLSDVARRILAVQSSVVVPVKNGSIPVGAVAAFSKRDHAFRKTDQIFLYFLTEMIEDSLVNQEEQSIPTELPAVIRAKKQWESAVDNFDHIVSLVDTSGRIMRMNRQVEEWQIAPVKSISGQTIHEVFHRECTDRDCKFSMDINKAWAQMVASGDSAWIAEIPAIGDSLYFSLRRTSHSDSLDSSMVGLFSVLTVRPSQPDEGINDNPKTERNAIDAKKNALAAKEQERRHIALELHDGIGQSLALVKFSLEGLRHDMKGKLSHQALGQMQEIVAHIHGSIEDVHRLSADLHPRYLESRSLPNALTLLCQELDHAYTGTSIKCDVDETVTDLAGSLKLTLFRVAQEALTNALKHSEADTVSVNLHRNANYLWLYVKDPGVGFDVAEVDNRVAGQGLSGIRERVELTGGTLMIVSNASEGTIISAAWPLDGDCKIICVTAYH